MTINKKNIYIGIATLLTGVLIGIFLANAERAQAPSSLPQDKNKTFSIIIIDRRLVDANREFTAIEGDTVSLNISTDEDEELHLHGYNKSIAITKGKLSVLTFIANATGRFPFELEHAGVELGAVSVYPK